MKYQLLLLSFSLTVQIFGQDLWVQRANLPSIGRHGGIGFNIGNKGYVGLGQINSGPQGDWEMNDMWQYDPASNSWSQVDSFLLSDNTAHLSSWSSGTSAYFGSDQLYKFNAENSSYTSLGVLNESVSFTAHTSCFGKEFFIFNDHLSWFYYGTEQWATAYFNQSIPTYPEKAIFSRDTIFVSGFSFNSWKLFYLDPVTLKHDTISSIPFNNLYNYELTTLNEELYFLFCGESSEDAGNKNYKFNLNTRIWEEFESFPGNGRRYFSSFKIGNRFFMCAGTNGTNHNDLWELIPIDTTSKPIQPTTELPDLIVEHPYPNPSNEWIYIQINNYDANKTYYLELFNHAGQRIGFIKTSQATFNVDCRELSSGTYFFNIQDGINNIKSGRFVVL